MGMAASQARLLSLTGRLHDVELSAQAIEAQKIALATQKDELYENYCEKLDATKIQVAFRNDAQRTYVDANYSTLCTYNENRYQEYTLKNNKTGRIIVSSDVKEKYDSFNNDKYTFAWAMLGYEFESALQNSKYPTNMGSEVGINSTSADYTGKYVESEYDFKYAECGSNRYNLYMTEIEAAAFEAYDGDEKENLQEQLDAVFEAETDSEKQKALDIFRENLYNTPEIVKNIFELTNKNKNGADSIEELDKQPNIYDTTWEDIKQEFNYYLHLWTAISDAGGCEAIDPQFESGDDGNTWFNNMVEAGLITIQAWDEKNTKNKGWFDTSVATSTNNNYLQNVQDEKDLKKAEAEYEHELDVINRKDTKFDTELSKLETERTSITTEMDAIKKVRDDNIDRTFGIFS